LLSLTKLPRSIVTLPVVTALTHVKMRA